MKRNARQQIPIDQELVVIENLATPLFSRERIALGLSQPEEALAEYGISICALAPYEAAKTPLLFIHGINDSPRCFAKLFASLDQNRFQPWFLFYPSGISLSFVGEYLSTFLCRCFAQYEFPQLGIVAHSMGGLIARRSLNLLMEQPAEKRRYLVPRFVTISTPWAGHDAARVGVKLRYPKMRPSWSEIASGGPFVRGLFSHPLPKETKYTLFFSHRRKARLSFVVSGMPYAGNHDGFVSLRSQLHHRAQTEATQVRGFEEDHRSILRSAALGQALQEVLQEL